MKKFFLLFMTFSLIFAFTACGDKSEDFKDYPVNEYNVEVGDDNSETIRVVEVPENIVSHEFILAWMNDMENHSDVNTFIMKYKGKHEGVVAYPALNAANYPVTFNEDFSVIEQTEHTKSYYVTEGCLVRAEDNEIVAKSKK